MSTVAVIAHAGKSLDGGLPALRKALERNGISDPVWHEVAKSRQAPKQVRSALKRGRRSDLRLGRRRNGPAVRRRRRRFGRDPGDRAGGHREPVRLEPRHTEAHRRGRRGRAQRRSSQVGRGSNERRDVCRHGRCRLRRTRHPRRNPEDEARARALGVRLGGREESSCQAVRGAGSSSTGRSGTKGWRAWFCSATSAMRSPA